MTQPACRICANTDGNRTHRAREMMFGTREEFEYIECAACGTLQIAEFPADLGRYYPENYLSFDEAPIPAARTWLHRLAARAAGKRITGRRSPLGWAVMKYNADFLRYLEPSVFAHPMGLTPDSRILDVGCGSGHLLRTLRCYGFHSLLGADAFIPRDIEYPSGVRVVRRSLEELEPAFDLIMLHHAFEHLTEPRATLGEIRRLLAPGGHALLRLPIVNYAWERYGVNWVQMDPPRHLYLYTERALKRLAGEEGFRVERVIYDSSGLQFWGSEQYERDLPLVAEGSSGRLQPASIFSAEQLAQWEAAAQRLNAEGRGDSAAFYLSNA